MYLNRIVGFKTEKGFWDPCRKETTKLGLKLVKEEGRSNREEDQ